MTHRICSLLSVALAGVFLEASLAMAAGGSWSPSKPIRVVVPFAAGGGADLIVRRIADRVRDRLGEPLIVDNRPGAGTAIGATVVAHAPADGLTLLLATTTTLCVNPLLRSGLPYQVADFAPVAVLQQVPFMVLTGPQMPVTSLAALIDYAHARPGRLNYGTLGIGTANHVLGSLFARSAGLDIVPLHYASASQVLLALTQGDVQLYFDGISTSVPRVKNAQLKGLAVTDSRRIDALPDIPTVAELGFPELALSVWYGLVAPAATPADVINRLNEVLNEVTRDKDVEAAMIAEGTRGLQITPQRFGELVARDTDTWRRAIEPLHIKLE